MARKIVETITDDIDGTEGAKSVQFAIDGSSYEIDLSGANASRLRDVLAPFVTSGRRVTVSASKGRSRSGHRPDRARSTAIREWAREHDIPVSSRGRIAASVVQQYDAAN